jgi:nucleoside-diphosphate-sugar epimerase
MKIAITGATGFIGTYLTNALYSYDNCNVRVIVRNEKLAKEKFGDKVEIFVADITIPETLCNCFSGCDAVVHLAALVAHNATLEQSIATNKNGTLNLVNEAKKSNVKKFILVSSTAAIGTATGLITEETKCKPVMSYQISKYETERECLKEYRENGFPILIVRPSMIYGEGVGQDLLTISKIIKSLHFFPIVGMGKNISPALYVSDMVEGLILLIEKGEVGQIYNLSSEYGYPMKQKVKIIAKTMNCKVFAPNLPKFIVILGFNLMSIICKMFRIQLDMQTQNIINTANDRVFDITKIKSLGFMQKVTLEDGISRTVEYFVKTNQL